MLSRRSFIGSAAGAALAQPARPNILLITADDMNWDTPGAFGGTVPGLTPNIDRLAQSGMRFERAHVTVAVCQPSRSALMTGRYPHRNGAEGFGPIRDDVPTLQERLHAAGYRNGILSKVEHLAPKPKFCWDLEVPQRDLGRGRDPQSYYRRAKEFFAGAAEAKRPFFLMANSDDPHRPFAGSDQEMKNFGRHMDYTRRIEPAQAVVPGFLPDIPEVRREVAEYMTSAHRCDQTVGAVLRALEESGQAGNTLVMFLSDNGMSFPYAKTNCYRNSTRTPWIARWPGVTRAGSVNRTDFISGIDFTPTVLEAAGLGALEGVDGRSFVNLLRGGSDGARDRVFTVFHETSAHQRYEMRCLQTARFAYLFNPWSNGQRVFKNESQNGRTFEAMRAAAGSDPRIAARVDFFLHRTPEEFYDLSVDPHALDNRIADAKFKPEIDRFRRDLLAWMRRTGDPLAAALEKRV